MKNSTGLSSVPSHHLVPFTDQLRLAVAAHLAASSAPPGTTELSDLRCYLACAHSTARTRWLLAADGSD
jgi:hypothetical protein